MSKHRELVVTMAEIMSSGKVAIIEKAAVVQALLLVAKDERYNSFAAREPKIVELLVDIASTIELEHTSNIRQLAIDALVHLSANPCNRRVLATYPRLLSSMIHYARLIGNSINAEGRPGLKRHILLLAKSL